MKCWFQHRMFWWLIEVLELFWKKCEPRKAAWEAMFRRSKKIAQDFFFFGRRKKLFWKLPEVNVINNRKIGRKSKKCRVGWLWRQKVGEKVLRKLIRALHFYFRWEFSCRWMMIWMIEREKSVQCDSDFGKRASRAYIFLYFWSQLNSKSRCYLHSMTS